MKVRFSPRPALLLLALLPGPALAQVTVPALPPAQVRTPPRLLTPDELGAEIARLAPAFGGFFLQGGRLHVVVTSSDPAARQSAVRELFVALGDELRRQGITPEEVVFVPGEFDAAELQRAREIAWGIPGWQSIDIDETRNRVVVELRLPGMEDRARAYLAGQGLHPGTVVLQSVPPGTLQEGPAFLAPHTAKLDVPARVAQGDMLRVELKVGNPGDEALVLEHGSCTFRLEVRRAETGEVVLPIPGNEICTSDLHTTTIPARGTGTLTAQEWNLRRPSGEPIPPGRYVVSATFGVGTPHEEVIRPPDVEVEVTAGSPGAGTAQVRDILHDGAYGITFLARLGEERGRQVLYVFVPDLRAQAGVEQLLRERRLPLDRVRFRTLPSTRVPQGSSQGEARLRVESHRSLGGTQHLFELEADVSPWLARGAWRCELVVNVVDPRSGEVVGGSPDFGGGRGPKPCSEGARPLPYPWGGGWNERRSDGTPLPPGRYEVRAGLRVSLRGGRVVWLLARTREVTVQ